MVFLSLMNEEILGWSLRHDWLPRRCRLLSPLKHLKTNRRTDKGNACNATVGLQLSQPVNLDEIIPPQYCDVNSM